jgi:hypothetical protein
METGVRVRLNLQRVLIAVAGTGGLACVSILQFPIRTWEPPVRAAVALSPAFREPCALRPPERSARFLDSPEVTSR